MAKIPAILHEPINTAAPMNVCLVATVLPNGYAQVSPRGSMMVLDGDRLAFWERSKGTTNEVLSDGTKVTVFFRHVQLRADGILPRGGIARFFGTARMERSGPLYDEVWRRMPEIERKLDSAKAGYAVVVSVERAEDLAGNALPENLSRPPGP